MFKYHNSRINTTFANTIDTTIYQKFISYHIRYQTIVYSETLFAYIAYTDGQTLKFFIKLSSSKPQ